jgi:hypothetical protein
MVALADPPNSGDSGDSGTGGKAMVAVANPPEDPKPIHSVTGRTVAGMRNPSENPRLDFRDIVVVPNPGGGDGSKAALAKPPVDPDPHPTLSFGIEVPGGGTRGNGPKVALAESPPDPSPVDSGTGRTVAGMRSLSDRDPWPDPPDIVIGPSPTGGEGPKAAAEGAPPIVIQHWPVPGRGEGL